MYLNDIAPSNALPELLNYSAPLSQQAQSLIKEIEQLKLEYANAVKNNEYSKLGNLNSQLSEKRNKLKELTASLSPQYNVNAYNERLKNQYTYTYSPETATSSLTAEDTIYGMPKMYVYGGGALLGIALLYFLMKD
jgi:hypothetical protein